MTFFFHPTLGWSQTTITADNPLGLQNDSLDRLRPDGRDKILFYGDSFVKGRADPDFHIPAYLHQRLRSADVIDLGVGGYGTDQILTEDLNRVLFSVRIAQKPYFVLDGNGELRLMNIPIERDQGAYFRRNPPAITSYLARLLARRLDVLQADTGPMKRRINSKIIDPIVSTCRDRGMGLLFVIFYGELELNQTNWREVFLKGELAGRGVPHFDSKRVLLDYAERNRLPLSAFYSGVQGDGHHNNLGNEVIADALLERLREFGYR